MVISLIGKAQADSVVKSLEVYFQGITIVAGGRTLTTDKEPFIYNGSTYVSLRMVADALGKKVTWDGANNQVIISDDPVKSIAQLGTLPPSDWHWVRGSANKQISLGGSQVKPGLLINPNPGDDAAYVTWPINGQYKTLEGIVGIPDGSYTEEAVITLYGDGRPLAKLNFVNGTAPQSFKVDVSGVLELKVKVHQITDNHCLACPGDYAIVGTLEK